MRNESKSIFRLLLFVGLFAFFSCEDITSSLDKDNNLSTSESVIENFETDFTLLSGQTGKGSLSVGEIEKWTFNAKAGDYIAVSVGEIGTSDIYPSISLISPSGSIIKTDYDAIGDSLWTNATEDGVYTILIHDYYDDDIGNYTTSLVISGGGLSISTGDEGGTITSGSTKTGTIKQGDIDAWTFEAKSGDYIAVSVGEVGTSDIYPSITLVSPGGSMMKTDYDEIGDSLWTNATENGVYTILIHDYYDDDIGNYTTSLVVSGGGLSISTGDEGGTITSGSTYTGTIEQGDIDGWTFLANSGDYVIVSVGEVGTSDIYPSITLVSPNGTMLKTDYDNSGESISTTVNETGIYTILIHDYYDDDIGSYTLSLSAG